MVPEENPDSCRMTPKQEVTVVLGRARAGSQATSVGRPLTHFTLNGYRISGVLLYIDHALDDVDFDGFSLSAFGERRCSEASAHARRPCDRCGLPWCAIRGT